MRERMSFVALAVLVLVRVQASAEELGEDRTIY